MNTVNLPANPSAIGPSLYDFEWDRHEAIADAKEAAESEIEKELLGIAKKFYPSKTEREEIARAMECVFERIFSSQNEMALFEKTLLEIWARHFASPDSPESRLSRLVGRGIAGYIKNTVTTKRNTNDD